MLNILRTIIEPNLVKLDLLNLINVFSLLSIIEISVNEILTKQIQEIEDALGNEVYFFSLKTDREQIDFNAEEGYDTFFN